MGCRRRAARTAVGRGVAGVQFDKVFGDKESLELLRSRVLDEVYATLSSRADG